MLFSLSWLARPMRWFSRPREVCYHCASRLRKGETYEVHFDHALRKVCCRGCAGVLDMIERQAMVEDYLRNRQNHQTVFPEKNDPAARS